MKRRKYSSKYICKYICYELKLFLILKFRKIFEQKNESKMRKLKICVFTFFNSAFFFFLS